MAWSLAKMQNLDKTELLSNAKMSLIPQLIRMDAVVSSSRRMGA